MSLFVVIQECQYSDRHEGVLQRFSSFCSNLNQTLDKKFVHLLLHQTSKFPPLFLNKYMLIHVLRSVVRQMYLEISFIISLEHPHTIAFAIIPETSTTAVLPGIVFALTIFDTPYFFIFFSAPPLSKA